MTSTDDAKTEADYRAEAAAHGEEAHDSFERSDTDGALSQWASGISARLASARADIAARGGKAKFPALFDLDGNLVPAKLVRTQYGTSFGLLSDPTDPSSPFTGWVAPSSAQSDAARRRNMAKKGYYVGTILAPAAATTAAPEGARGLGGALSVYIDVFRTDGGFDANAEVVDNGVTR